MALQKKTLIFSLSLITAFALVGGALWFFLSKEKTDPSYHSKHLEKHEATEEVAQIETPPLAHEGEEALSEEQAKTHADSIAEDLKEKTISKTTSDTKAPSLSGSPQKKADAPELAATPKPSEIKKPELECKKVSYSLNNRVPAQVREKIQNFRNVIPLPSDQKRMDKTVCIRIDGTPIAYQKMRSQTNALMIDGGVSAQSKIEVSYCSGKGQCPLECVIPKDDFLISLGGSTGGNELDQLGADTVGWQKDQKLSAEELELQKNAKQIQEIFAVGGEQDSRVFNGWTIKEEIDVGCGNIRGQQLSQR